MLQLTNTRYFLTNIPELPFIGNTTLVKGPVATRPATTVYLYRFNGDESLLLGDTGRGEGAGRPGARDPSQPEIRRDSAQPCSTPRRMWRSLKACKALPAPLADHDFGSTLRAGQGRRSISSAPAPQGSALVVSENYYPGWTATVDGKPARIGRADYTLIGVQLPSGARSVELNFTSPSYQQGKVITWIAIALGLLLLGAGIWRDRRRLA